MAELDAVTEVVLGVFAGDVEQALGDGDGVAQGVALVSLAPCDLLGGELVGQVAPGGRGVVGCGHDVLLTVAPDLAGGVGAAPIP